MMLFLIFLNCLVQSRSIPLSYNFYHKNQSLFFQAVNLYFYAFEISLFEVFINASKLTDEISIDWSFSLVFEIQ